jgi:hypothetical protein
MPRITELRRLFDVDQRLREDFISTLAGFFERHHIEVSPEDLEGAEDIVGYLFSPRPLAATDGGEPRSQ